MAFTVEEHLKFLGQAKGMGQAVLARGRIKRVGKNIVDANGNPIILRGYNYGEELLYQNGDLAADKAAGANAVRFVFRGWGGNAAPKLDALQVGSPLGGDYSQAGWDYFGSRIKAAKAAGLIVRVDFDSDCGQNGNQGMPSDPSTFNFCTLSGSGGQNFFTPLGISSGMRAAHVNHIRIVLRKFHGMIDIVGPLVEPNPADGYPGVYGQADINKFYLECMHGALAEDPNLIFSIGGVSWRNDVMEDPMTQGTVWPTDQLMLTTDFLDSSMSQDDATFAASLHNVTQARLDFGFPVDVNQCGLQTSSDNATFDTTAKRLESLRTANGGSINWWWWEKVSKTFNSYGPWMDNTDNGTNRNYATNGAAKQARIEAAFKAAPIYPT